MDDGKHKSPAPPQPHKPGAAAERRRSVRISHDHRGTAIAEWVDVPPDTDRQPLSIVEPARQRDSFDPYERTPVRSGPRRAKRDLRKLSEWIETTRRVRTLQLDEDDE